MRHNWFRICALCALTMTMVSGAFAEEVRQHYIVVNPADFAPPGASTGWALGIEQGWNFENGVWVQASTPSAQLSVGAMVPPLGFRSLNMVNPYSTGDTAYPPSHMLNKVYVGLNDFSGIALSDIVTLKYSTYLQHGDYSSGQTFLGQPPQLEIITDSGTTLQERTFYFKPWGMQGANGAQERVWQEWDCLAPGGVWVLGQTSSSNVTGDWNWVKNRYGGGTMKLRTPLVGDYTTPMSPAPDLRLSNQSGTSIAIKIGSGTCLYLNNYPAPLYQQAWWPECSGINAYVDKFVIGVRRSDGSIDEYTYDFDDPAASPLGTPVAMSNRAAAESIVTNESTKRPIVIYGKVGTYVGDYHPGLYFHVYDGSTKPDGSPAWVRIYSPGNTLPQPGEFSQFYVRAQGRLDNTGTTKTLYANPEDISFWEIPLW
jgi:hypothetical protein